MTAATDTAGRITSPLDHGRLRSRLAAGRPTLGTFVGTASAVTAEVCAAAGVDWVLLDLEHGAGGEEQVGTVVLATAAYGVPTVVRVESAARIRLGRVLDLGAAGVMLPRLETVAEVREALRHLRYPLRETEGWPRTTGRAASGWTREPLTGPTQKSSRSCRSSRHGQWSRWRR
jgi:2-keto-3-deoxy-L-rhamnonate aldolase RhmA